MCNENLAVRIKNGEKWLVSYLWEQNTGLIHQKAYSLFIKHYERCISSGVALEDIVQVCYFALLDAIEAFDPASGFKLMTYLNFPFLTHFNMLIGTRTSKQDPLNQCVSLDTPVGEDGYITRLGLIADSDSVQPFEAVIDDIFAGQVNKVLEAAVSKLPEPCITVIRGRYYQGKTRDEIAAEMCESSAYIQRIERKGIAILRRESRKREWVLVRAELLASFAFRHRGIRTFRNTGLSSVEYAIIRTEEFAENVQ